MRRYGFFKDKETIEYIVKKLEHAKVAVSRLTTNKFSSLIEEV